MTDHGVILYGPPASGKDAVTHALVRLDSTFRHYQRLKAGTGRTTGYEMIGEAALAEIQRGDVLYENTRYGNRYLVDRPRLRELFETGVFPVVHIGQIAGIRAIVSSYPARWLAVMLWCSRETSRKRASARQYSSDITSRLDAWDETERDVSEHGSADFALCIDTERHLPDDAARLVGDAVRSWVNSAR